MSERELYGEASDIYDALGVDESSVEEIRERLRDEFAAIEAAERKVVPPSPAVLPETPRAQGGPIKPGWSIIGEPSGVAGNPDE